MKRTALFISLLAGTTAFGQQDTTDLTPVEVRALRANATAPFAKTNITKGGIERQNLGQDLPFLLNQAPSVLVNSDAGNGVGYTGIRVRGSDATRINVTLNGVPFNDPESQGAFFVDLPDFASSLSSIQIQRGVGTSQNGAGAFGATINLSTTEQRQKAYLELNNSYGSFDTWKNTVKVGTGLLGDHFSADMRLSNISSNGYIDRAKTSMGSYFFSAAYTGDKSTLRFNTFSGNEKTYQAWNGVSEADLKNNRTANSAGTERPGTPYENETDNYNQTHYQLFFNHKILKNLLFNTGVFYVRGKGYYEQYKADQKYSSYGIAAPVYGGQAVSRTDVIRQLWLDNDFYGDVFSLEYQQGKSLLQLGGAYTNYVGNHYGELIWAKAGLPGNNYRWYDLDADKKDYNVYAKWQQDITANFQSFFDLQYRGVNYNINGFRYNPTLVVNSRYNFFNPKAGLTYHKGNLMAFASYSIANKEPIRDDFEASPTEKPKAERLNDVEIGVEKKAANYNVGATVYYMKYKDQLVLTGKINDVGAYTRTNIDESYRAGVELQGGISVSKILKAAANLTFSRNKIKNFNEFVDDYDANFDWMGQKQNVYKETDISFSPNVTGAATITLMPTNALSFDFISKYVGKQYLDNTSNESRKLNPYFLQDVRGVYSFAKKGLQNVTIIAQVNNVFNKKYEPNGYTFSYYYGGDLATENYYYPMAGTNYNIGLGIKL